jgi:hypothetical protein
MVKLTGAGGGCGTPETVGPEDGGSGVPAEGGLVVVIDTSVVSPGAGG